jgi:branched-chain amino acid transport system substrate-binding protein
MRLMLRLETLLTRRLAPAAVCALAIAACGSQHKPTSTTSTTTTTTTTPAASSTVAIYSSLPDSGADAAHSRQIEAGIRLALDQAGGKAGSFKVVYYQRCDSAVPRKRPHGPTSRNKISASERAHSRKCSGNWSPTAVVRNAGDAARNPQTVAYIGDLNSGATELSLPILNQAGIVQVTPGSGYVGLTNAITVKNPKGLTITLPGEPGKYYPQGSDPHTLLRMIPNDLVQASAALDVLAKTSCQKFTAWKFGSDQEATSLFDAVIATAAKYKLDYVPAPPRPDKDSYATYVSHVLAPTGIHCAVMVGHITNSAESLTLELREQLSPPPAIVGTTGFCVRAWLQGIPSEWRKDVAASLSCLTPALPVSQYAGHARFTQLFQRTDHRPPTTYNLYGYEATEMLLRALHNVDSDEDVRQQVLTSMAYNEIDNIPGQASAFSFYPIDGNLATNTDYGVAEFVQGTLRYTHKLSIDETHLLSSG